MVFQCIVKGNQDDAVKAAAEHLPENTVVIISKVNPTDTIIRVAGTAHSLQRCLYDWFAADGATMPDGGFPAGSLLWHSGGAV